MEKWILAVGYDKTTTQAAQREWLKHGFYVVVVADMRAAMELLPRKDFLLVAIFSSDPPLAQIAALLKIKPTPILIVADEDNPDKRLEALRLGAVDYMVWPGSLERGVEYGKAVLERFAAEKTLPSNGDGIIEISGLRMDVNSYSVTVNDTDIELTGKEFQILRLLMTRPGQFFTHQMIFSQVWGAEHEDTDRKILNNLIYKLRTKLKVPPDAPIYIKTKKGVGYKFDP